MGSVRTGTGGPCSCGQAPLTPALPARPPLPHRRRERGLACGLGGARPHTADLFPGDSTPLGTVPSLNYHPSQGRCWVRDQNPWSLGVLETRRG